MLYLIAQAVVIMPCWMNHSSYINTFHVYDITTVLNVEVFYAKRGTGCLFI